MRVPDSVLEEIKEKISLQDVVSEYVTLQNKGSRLWGLCPFHTEKTPSFSVDDQKGLYFCYGCKKGGSVFNFVMEMEQISFPEAIRKLAEKAHVDIPQELEHSEAYDQAAKEQKQLYELNARLKESFHHILLNHKAAEPARQYLSSRGVSAEMIEHFSLGYLFEQRTWLYKFLKKNHYSDEFLAQSGLFSKKYPEISLFGGRVLFPISDRQGRVVAFGGRSLKREAYAKYINSPETPVFLKRKTLYGLHESKEGMRKNASAILCEGYFDVLALHQAGFPFAVAPLGTACTIEHAYELKRFAKQVYLMFDQDAAGIDAMTKTLPMLEQLDLDTQIIVTPKGKDPADLFADAPDKLINCIKNPINSFEYLVKTLTERYDVYLPEGKRSIFQHTYPLIASTTSEIKRNEYLRILADHLQLDVAVLYDDYRAMYRSSGKGPVIERRNDIVPENDQLNIQMDVELYIMVTLLANGKLYSRFRNDISKYILRNRTAKDLHTVLEDAFRRGVSEVDAILQEITDPRLKSFFIQELESGSYSTYPEQIVVDGLRRLQLRKLDQQQRKIVRKIKELEKRQDAGSLQELRELLYEKKYLDEEIQEIRKPV